MGKMMELFYESKDVFLLKDLEKLAPKLKGITSMSVKDVVMSLVNDGMVDTDKIGTSVYFWAFPSKASAARKRKLDTLSEQLEKVTKKTKQLEEEAVAARVGREESDERVEVLSQLEKETAKEKNLREMLKEFADNDPEVLNKMKADTKIAHAAANRWTDNIFAVQDWVKNKFPSIDQEVFGKQFGVPEDLEYIE